MLVKLGKAAIEPRKGISLVQYSVIIPAGTAIGQTIDAMIGLKPTRVMLLSEAALRVEPDAVFMTMFAITEDGQTAITCAGRCNL
jgi:hypothetical protein